jgi:protease-4
MIYRVLWAIGIGAFLFACLGVGLMLADTAAPPPRVGVVTFDEVIDFGTAAWINRIVEEATGDPSIAAVVLEINSPGGYAVSSESIYYTLLKLRAEKPLVVYVDGLAASGGYYMAAAGNRIFAPASAYVGNVGTRGGRPVDPSILPEELSSAPYKLSGGSRFDQFSQLDLVARSFISNVVAQRAAAEVTPLRITAETVAEARVYLGSEALATGLIDAEGGRSDAVAAAAELAGLTGYDTVDLAEWYGIEKPDPFAQPVIAAGAGRFAARTQQLVAQAPPGTVYMLDQRIPLPGLAVTDPTRAHLLRLRAAAPAPFRIPLAESGGGDNGGGRGSGSLIPASPAPSSEGSRP